MTVVTMVGLFSMKPGVYPVDPKKPISKGGASIDVTAAMISGAKIFVGVALLFQMVWFSILRGLWHSISSANVAGIDKYLKMYVVIYLLNLSASWYSNKKRGVYGSKYWYYGAAVDVAYNVWFIHYSHGVHGLIDNIRKHDEHWTFDCDKPYF